MELRHLEHFVAVAEEASFTRAAQRLGIVQSGVSASIRALEREVGLDLFDRTTHRVDLTAAGEVLLPEARRTLAAAAAARDALDEVRGGLRGRLTVGTMQAQALQAMKVNVAELIARFREEHPAVEIHLRHAAGGSRELAEWLREGRVDIAFLALPEGDHPGIELRQLSAERVMFACSPKHRLAGRRAVELKTIAGETFADFPPGWGVRMAVDRAFAAAGLQRTVTYEVNDTAGVLDFVQHGLGVAVIPPSFAEGTETLRFVPIRRGAPLFTTSVGLPANRPLSATGRALLASL
jgi:DNA-binding transcriptional LysR family regulator